MGGRIVERTQEITGAPIIAPALDAQGPLPHRRQKNGQFQPLGHVLVQAQPVESAQARITPSNFPVSAFEPGLDVTPDRLDAHVRPKME